MSWVLFGTLGPKPEAVGCARYTAQSRGLASFQRVLVHGSDGDRAGDITCCRWSLAIVDAHWQ